MSFHVGMKVVCVGCANGGEPRFGEWLFSGPGFIIGQVYVVRGVDTVRTQCGDMVGLYIIGHSVIWKVNGKEYPFDARGFRPLEEMKEEARQRQQSQLPTHSPASK